MVICKRFNICSYGHKCKHGKPHDNCNISPYSNCYDLCDCSKLKVYDRTKKLKKIYGSR